MARKSKLDLNLAIEIIGRLKDGCSLVRELKRNKIGYATWRLFCTENHLKYEISKGKRPTIYTIEKAMEVKRRANDGEFVSNICEELGMNYNNFCRFCRNNHIKILNEASLVENVKRRNYGQRSKSIEVSKDDLEAIIKNVTNGSSLKSELKKAGFSYSTWRDRCLEFDIKFSSSKIKKNQKYTLKKIRQMKKKVKEGESLESVCENMNWQLKEVVLFCKSKNMLPPAKWKISEEESGKVKKVKQLLESDCSPAYIAQKLSISSSYVYLIRRKCVFGI